MTQPVSRDTLAWRFQVWASFLIAFGFTGLGILVLPTTLWVKGFLTMGLLFTVGSCFSLSKTLRDEFEGRRLRNRITEAKAEQILREYEAGPA